MSKNTIDTTSLEDVSLNAFAYELLREELLPDLIGNDLDGILYWSGRNLARKYPLDTIEEVIQFFEKAGWGTLSIIEHKRREMQFQLKGTLIAERQKQKRHSSYQLEAGFIAEQIQSNETSLQSPTKKRKNVQTLLHFS